ncbi:MAG TPA: ABC transporter permease [Dongiaceae bacterium]|nr:ABC transporter permease [Dongiaceae bacterium]
MNDLRFAFRQLVKNPGFTVVAVLTLALGIGANTAIFSLVNAVLIRALPYPNPDQLAVVWSDNPGLKLSLPVLPAANSDIAAWREQTRSFARVAAFTPGTADLADSGEPERVGAARVTDGFFETLGIAPLIGRAFTREEDRLGRPSVAMIGYGLWQRRFGGDPALVGKTITVNGDKLAVVGILPPEFDFPRAAEWPCSFPFAGRTEVWLPLAFSVRDWQTRDERGLVAIGRLRTEAGLRQAQAEMDAFAASQAKEHPDTHNGWTLKVMPLRAQLAGKSQTALLILFAAVGLLLLIACVNVANLLLARGAARQKELALRAALGAPRLRLLRQLFTESLVLAGCGCAFGLLLGFGCLRLFLRLNPLSYSRLSEASIDLSVLAFAALAALGTSIAFGLVPALQGTKLNLRDSLQADGRGAGSRRQRARGLLVGSQAALAIILLMGAGLMVRSFLRVQAVNLGFRPDSVLAFDVQLSNARYGDDNKQAAFFSRLLARLEVLPGVRAAGAISYLPLSGGENLGAFTVEGASPVRPEEEPIAERRSVTPGYFSAMGIPVRAGRVVTAADAAGQPLVVVVNETLARQFFNSDTPIGKRLQTAPAGSGPWRTVIGVVSDVRSSSLEAEPRPQIYFPHAQASWASMTVVLLARGEPAALASAARSGLRALDPALPAAQMRTLRQVVSTATRARRFNMALLVLFAGTALFLTTIGIYGVVSYLVGRQRREIGIRLALGAPRGHVRRMIFQQGMKPVCLGSLLGLAGSLAGSRLLASQLYGVSSSDPLTLAIIVTLLFSVALLACWLPARRAAKVDPAEALRYE